MIQEYIHRQRLQVQKYLAIKLVQKTKSKIPYKKLVATQCGLELNEIENALESFESRITTRPSIKPNSK